MLYSLNGAVPIVLPFRIRLSDGRTRTDPTTFTHEEIADAGYIEVPDKPAPTANQIVEWSNDLIEWVVRNKTPEEIEFETNVKNSQLKQQITEWRDKLITNGFYFNNEKFDSRPEDQKRISGSVLLAYMAVSNGAEPGDLYWHGGNEPFAWIAKNNSIVTMDAQTVIEFGKVAAEHERSHIFAARTLKDMDPIPEDFTDPNYWP